MKKCAIIFEKINKIEINKYKTFIGVEKGSINVLKIKDKETFHISDFDSSSSKKILKHSKNVTILEKEKNFVDGEEAVIFALKQGFKAQDIDLFIPNNISSRPDHFMNMINIVRKYGVTVMNLKMKAILLDENTNTIIYNKYKYLSIFITETTNITTKGLKWDMNDRVFDINSSTTMISNEIKDEYAEILANKKTIVITSND